MNLHDILKIYQNNLVHYLVFDSFGDEGLHESKYAEIHLKAKKICGVDFSSLRYECQGTLLTHDRIVMKKALAVYHDELMSCFCRVADGESKLQSNYCESLCKEMLEAEL